MGVCEPKLAAWTKEYDQEADTCSSHDYQNLTIEQIDGGGGPFWRIQTTEWAIDSIEALVKVLKDAGVSETEPEI